MLLQVMLASNLFLNGFMMRWKINVSTSVSQIQYINNLFFGTCLFLSTGYIVFGQRSRKGLTLHQPCTSRSLKSQWFYFKKSLKWNHAKRKKVREVRLADTNIEVKRTFEFSTKIRFTQLCVSRCITIIKKIPILVNQFR